MPKTGKVVRQGKRFSLTEASPDHPIYKRGFVIGGNHSMPSSKSTQGKTSASEKKRPPRASSTVEKALSPEVLLEFVEETLLEEIRCQMRGKAPSGQTAQSALATIPDSKGS